MGKYSSTKKGKEARADVQASLSDSCSLKLRFWIESGGDTFLASGRAELLQRVDETKSISQAARSMGMSYAHAWKLIDEMNRLAGSALVETETGGSSGGGAHLTETGRKAVVAFFKLQEDMQRIIEEADLKWV